MRMYQDERSNAFISRTLSISEITVAKIIKRFENDPEYITAPVSEIMLRGLMDYMVKTCCPECKNTFITLTSVAYPMCTKCFHQFPLHSGVKGPEQAEKFVFGE